MKEKRDDYLKILAGSGFELAAAKAMDDLFQEPEQEIISTISCVVAPALIRYVLWVLEMAQRKRQTILYFLARDGKIMCEIAQILCRRYQLDIQCRYFHCSRYVLRLQLFQIDFSHALRQFCAACERPSLQAVLLRGGLSQAEQMRVWQELGVDYSLTDALSRAQLEALREQLSASVVFRRVILEKSSDLCEKFLIYLKQEGMTGGDIAIVDSGWSGSMQESLCRILQHNNLPVKTLTGYYFGLTGMPEPGTGTYHGYYFDRRGDFRGFYHFNNNLFECLCSADHGMTIGYRQQGERMAAVLKPYQPVRHVALLSDVCLKVTEHYAALNDAPATVDAKAVRALLRSLMGSPSRAEGQWFGGMPFSDDVSEIGLTRLAAQLAPRELCSFYLTQKLAEKLLARPKLQNRTFWAQGSIAQLSSPLSWWRRLDFELLNLLKYLWAKYVGPK